MTVCLFLKKYTLNNIKPRTGKVFYRYYLEKYKFIFKSNLDL